MILNLSVFKLVQNTIQPNIMTRVKIGEKSKRIPQDNPLGNNPFFGISLESGLFTSKFGIVKRQKSKTIDDDTIIENMARPVRVFFAGSQVLQEERGICASIVARLQPVWRKQGIGLEYYDSESAIFSQGLNNNGGPQPEYEAFIRDKTDVFVVVLSGKIGDITYEEFKCAIDSLKKNGKPRVFVFAKDHANCTNENEEIKNMVSEMKQYWIPYNDNDVLREKFEITFNRYLQNWK